MSTARLRTLVAAYSVVCWWPMSAHAAWTNYDVFFTNVTVTCNPEYMAANATISPGGRSYNMAFAVHQPFDRFHMSLVVEMRLSGAAAEPRQMLDTTVEFCEYTQRQPMPDVMLRTMFDAFRVASVDGFMLRCPVAVGAYRIVRYRVDLAKLPPLLPSATFVATMAVFTQQRHAKQPDLFAMRIAGMIDSPQAWTKWRRGRQTARNAKH